MCPAAGLLRMPESLGTGNYVDIVRGRTLSGLFHSQRRRLEENVLTIVDRNTRGWIIQLFRLLHLVLLPAVLFLLFDGDVSRAVLLIEEVQLDKPAVQSRLGRVDTSEQFVIWFAEEREKRLH